MEQDNKGLMAKLPQQQILWVSALWVMVMTAQLGPVMVQINLTQRAEHLPLN